MLDKGVERRGPPKPAGLVARFFVGLGRLVVPVVALLSALGVYWAFDVQAADASPYLTHFDEFVNSVGSHKFGRGLLVLPLVYLVLNLTSRRYGPGLALWTVVLSWALLGGGVYWGLTQGFITSFGNDIMPVPQALALGLSLLAGQVFCIYFFDWLRGIPWWEAPLVAALVGGLTQTFAFHIIDHVLASGAMAGVWQGDIWPRLALLSAIQLAWAIVQLLPTAILRGAIRPLSGYGGA